MTEGDRDIPREFSGLRQGVDAPDLSASILREVDRRRGWLSGRQRRWVGVARWATCAAVLGVAAGALLVQRVSPVDQFVSPEPRPLVDLMRTVRDETSVAVQTVSTRVRSIPEELVTQSQQMMVTGRMQRVGDARVIELDGPITVVDEVSPTPTLLLADWAEDFEHLSGGEVLMPENGAYSIRFGTVHYGESIGVGWPSSLGAPLDPEAPLFEAAGLDR